MSDKLTATGTIYRINEAVQVTERFRKRTFVLEMGGKSPQFVEFELVGNECEHLDEYSVGEKTTVEFELRGREWTSPDTGQVRFFTTLRVGGMSFEGGKRKAAPVDDNVPF